MRVEADGKHAYFRFVRLSVTVTRFPVAEFVNPLDFLEDISFDALVSHAAWSRRLRLQAVRLACPQRNLCATLSRCPQRPDATTSRCHHHDSRREEREERPRSYDCLRVQWHPRGSHPAVRFVSSGPIETQVEKLEKRPTDWHKRAQFRLGGSPSPPRASRVVLAGLRGGGYRASN